MEAAPAAPASPRTSSGRNLSPWSVVVLAAWFGVVGGYLDLGAIFLKRDLFHATLYYEQGRHFRWVVPLANLIVMLVPGFVVAGITRFRPGVVSARSAAWLFGTLAFWAPLLRAPLYGVASLLLACGAARGIRRLVDRPATGVRRFIPVSLAALALVLSTTMVVALRRQWLEESRASARLPRAPDGTRNVLLIVMDTVRADSLGMYGYARDTTPQLARWAKRGVKFDLAVAPAPWTFPSHCSFLTGQPPSTLGAHWRPNLDRAYPTLAEYLAGHGYATAGFAANTYWCSYESGMNRGFAHYEDYPLTARSILGSTIPGRWLLTSVLHPGDYYNEKWVRAQSRDGRGINQAFLDWLGRPRGDRPFFAFLNYLDAHEPFLPPSGTGSPFGLRAESSRDSKMLLDYWDRDKSTLSEREVRLAQDAYDDCVSALDRQIGLLLDDLDRRGELRDTLVIVTSDHGEQFGEHGVFNHGFSLYAHEVRVPLLIVSPGALPGKTVSEPVSLSVLPATVADVCGLAAGSPFPGRSLAESWGQPRSATGGRPPPAVSEVDIPLAIAAERGRGSNQRGYTTSLVEGNLHYIISINGNEELYDLSADPRELRNLKNALERSDALGRFRSEMLQILSERRVANGVAGGYHEQLRVMLQSMLTRPST
jgi:arylsulfatase A-like enzyme